MKAAGESSSRNQALAGPASPGRLGPRAWGDDLFIVTRADFAEENVS